MFPTLAAYQSHLGSFFLNSNARDPPPEILMGLAWDLGPRIFFNSAWWLYCSASVQSHHVYGPLAGMGIKVNEEVFQMSLSQYLRKLFSLCHWPISKKINSLNVQVQSTLAGFFFNKNIKSNSFALKIINKGKRSKLMFSMCLDLP